MILEKRFECSYVLRTTCKLAYAGARTSVSPEGTAPEGLSGVPDVDVGVTAVAEDTRRRSRIDGRRAEQVHPVTWQRVPASGGVRLRWVPGEGVWVGTPAGRRQRDHRQRQTHLPPQEPNVGAGTLIIKPPAEKANPRHAGKSRPLYWGDDGFF